MLQVKSLHFILLKTCFEKKSCQEKSQDYMCKIRTFLNYILNAKLWLCCTCFLHIDNLHYLDNAIPIKSWFSDPSDTALLDLLPVLDALRFVSDVRSILNRNREAQRQWWVFTVSSTHYKCSYNFLFSFRNISR